MTLFQSAKENPSQFTSSSDLPGPPALSSAKMTLNIARCLVVWPGFAAFCTVSCAKFAVKGQDAKQAAPRLQGLLPDIFLLPQCLLWITEWSPHTLSSSFQDRKTQRGHSILLSGQKTEFLPVRCMASFGAGSKTSGSLSWCVLVSCVSFSWKQHLAWKLMDLIAGELKP